MPRGEAVSANYPETGAMSGRKINFVKRCACHARVSADVRCAACEQDERACRSLPIRGNNKNV